MIAAIYWLIGLIQRYRPTPGEAGLLLLGMFGSIVTILVLINGQMTMFLLAIIVLFLLLLKKERLFLAGFTLAFIAVKPNPFILFVPLVGLWLLLQKQWRVIGGGITGTLTLLAVSWLLKPGWLLEWLNVREKTSVVTITPTVWGLSAEISEIWWLPIGLVLTTLIVAGVGWLIFTKPALPAEAVIGLALSASLLTTPYIWTYEHALLFLPWAWLFATLQNRRLAQGVWLLLAFVVPWLLFLIAAIRINDSLGFVSPLLALVGVWWLQGRRS